MLSLLRQAIGVGALAAMVQMGVISPLISKRKAIRLYGASAIERWERDGNVKSLRKGKRIYYAITDLETAKISEL